MTLQAKVKGIKLQSGDTKVVPTDEVMSKVSQLPLIVPRYS